MAAPEPRLSAGGAFPEVAYLDDLRRALVEGGPPLPEITQRLLLDTLGIGNRQAFDFLCSQRPDRAGFEAWLKAIAGEPDPTLLARYHDVVLRGQSTPIAEIDQAPDVLDADAIKQWEREGWVLVPQAIPASRCADVAALIWDYLGASPDDPASWYGNETEGIMVPIYQHEALEIARRSPRVHEAFAQLWGRSDLWVTIDQLGFNPPETPQRGFQGTPLHWDASLVPPIPFATQALIYLTDTQADQGAFRCVPGFHHRIEVWLDGLGDTDPRSVDLSQHAVCIPGQAGDLVIWRQDLPHGASPNRADQPRLVQYLNFYPPDLEIAEEWR